jgi:hypothetical protein
MKGSARRDYITIHKITESAEKVNGAPPWHSILELGF